MLHIHICTIILFLRILLEFMKIQIYDLSLQFIEGAFIEKRTRSEIIRL
jgi:hypothetical protein